MEIQLFGVIWVIITGIAFYFNIRYLACLMIVSTIFQSCSMLNIDDHSLSPMLFTCSLLILRYIVSDFTDGKVRLNKSMRLVLYFLIYMIAVTLIAPFFLKGVQVVSHADSVRSTVITTGVRLSNVEWISLLSIAIYIVAGICLYQVKEYIKYSDIVNICKFTLLFEFMVSTLIQFLYNSEYFSVVANFFYGQDSSSWKLRGVFYMVGELARYQGTFTEPSVAGPLFVALFWFFAFSKESMKWIYCFISIICMALNLSTTCYLTFAISIIVVILIMKKYKILAWLIPVGLLATYFMNKLEVFEFAYRQIFAKFNDSNVSFMTRIQWDINALKGFISSHGIGIGYCTTGSNSFCAAILLQGGVIGTILLIRFIMSLLKYREDNKGISSEPLNIFLLVILIGMSVAVGNFVYCPFWMAIYFMIAVQQKEVLTTQRH